VSRRLRIEPQASAEADAAAGWFDSPGAALAFLEAVREAIETIEAWPGFGAPVAEVGDGAVIRQLRLKGFPYHIGYLLTDDQIRVLAVAHERRKPGYWLSRR
jgi:plasmid stabilization system protein ParE